MDRSPARPHAILLEWRTGNRKFIWSGLMEELKTDSCIRGFHVYQDKWIPPCWFLE